MLRAPGNPPSPRSSIQNSNSEVEMASNEKLTISQVKAAKMALELSILEQAKAFEASTGMRLNYLRIIRKPVKRKDGEEWYDHEQRIKGQSIENIEAECELDLSY